MSEDFSGILKMTFEQLCKPIAAEEVTRYRAQIEARLADYQSQKDFIGPNVHIAEKVASSLIDLVEEYSTIEANKQSLVIGALEYFLLKKDGTPDETPIVGFDDDLLVLNFVLGELGKEQLSSIATN